MAKSMKGARTAKPTQARATIKGKATMPSRNLIMFKKDSQTELGIPVG
jgi:hypothetical protein